MADDEWPLKQYNPGPHAHLHALGVIAVTFASLETHVEILLSATAKRRNADASAPNFSRLSEKNKIKAMKSFFAEQHTRPDVIACADNLFDFFDWCQHCRNQLLHAERYPGFLTPKDTMYLTKRMNKSSGEFGFVKLTLEQIQGIAEDIRAAVVQCANLSLYLRFENRPRDKIDPAYRPYTDSLPSALIVPERMELALWPKPDA